MTDCTELYLATKALFGFLSLFDQNWEEGWRPMLDVGRCGADILYLSKLGSYVRMRGSERVDEPVFHLLHDMLTKRAMHARREPYYFGAYRQATWDTATE